MSSESEHPANRNIRTIADTMIVILMDPPDLKKLRISFHRVYVTRYTDQFPSTIFLAEMGYLSSPGPDQGSAAPVGIGVDHKRLGTF